MFGGAYISLHRIPNRRSKQMSHFTNAAHTAGYEAAYEGQTQQDCPFGATTGAGKAWMAGYEQAIRNQRDERIYFGVAA